MAISYTVVTPAERPEPEAEFRELHRDAWPRFLNLGNTDSFNQHWRLLFTTFAGFQFALCDEGGGVMAVGNTIPVDWDLTVDGLPRGIVEELAQGVGGLEQGRKPRRSRHWRLSFHPSANVRG